MHNEYSYSGHTASLYISTLAQYHDYNNLWLNHIKCEHIVDVMLLEVHFYSLEVNRISFTWNPDTR